MSTIVEPSGRVIHSGFIVGCLSSIDASGRIKYPVVLEPRMPWCVGI